MKCLADCREGLRAASGVKTPKEIASLTAGLKPRPLVLKHFSTSWWKGLAVVARRLRFPASATNL